jgi:chromosome segregation ATPase
MSLWEDWKADFRDGYCEAQREAEEQRAMFGQRGDAVEREREWYWQQGVPARDRSSQDSNRRALIELCEEQAARIADYEAQLDEYRAALGDREQENTALRGRLDQYAAALAARDAQISTLADELRRTAETRDTYQTNGKRLNAEVRLILQFPGALDALQKALHPDTGQGGNVRSRTEVFQILNAVRDRLGLNKRKR